MTEIPRSLKRIAKALADAAIKIEPPPCDACWEKPVYKITGHECNSFKTWARTGSTKEELK